MFSLEHSVFNLNVLMCKSDHLVLNANFILYKPCVYVFRKLARDEGAGLVGVDVFGVEVGVGVGLVVEFMYVCSQMFYMRYDLDY